jgi:hypothetical protein
LHLKVYVGNSARREEKRAFLRDEINKKKGLEAEA